MTLESTPRAYLYKWDFPAETGLGPIRRIARNSRLQQQFNQESYTINVGAGNEVFFPTSGSHSQIRQDQKVQKQSVSYNTAIDDEELKDAFVGSPTTGRISFTIFEATINTLVSPIIPEEVLVAWRGRVASVRTKGEGLEIYTENLFTRLRENGNRVKYSRQCRHILYGTQCRVNPNNFDSQLLVVAVEREGLIIQIPPVIGRRVEGGSILFNNKYYFIVDYDPLTEKARLDKPIPGILPGDTVTFFPGCNRSPSDCATFNNLVNFGGFPLLPAEDPFSLTSLV